MDIRALYSNEIGATASDVVFLRYAPDLSNISSDWLPPTSIGVMDSKRAQVGIAQDQDRMGVVVDAATALTFTVRSTDGYIFANPISFVDRIDQIIAANDAVRCPFLFDGFSKCWCHNFADLA